MLFLCVILGYYIDHQSSWFYKPSLPDSFPSDIMIKELKKIYDNSSLLPYDTQPMFVKAISALVQHNSKHGFTDWTTIFALAPRFDATYSFIDSIEVYDYKERPDDFIKLLKEVKLSVNDLKDANVLNKMINKLIKISYDAECLIYLQEHFKELENDSNLLCGIRSRLLELFKGKKLYWNDKNVTSLHKLLKDRNLKWQQREYASILEAIAESNQVNLLKSFPEIFNFISGLKLNTIKKKLEQESTKWFIKICKQQKKRFKNSRKLGL